MPSRTSPHGAGVGRCRSVGRVAHLRLYLRPCASRGDADSILDQRDTVAFTNIFFISHHGAAAGHRFTSRLDGEGGE